MNIKLSDMKTEKQWEQVKELYFDAFPKEERKPIEVLRKGIEHRYTKVFVIEDGDRDFAGEVIMMLDRDIAFLDYFAVSPNMRGKGIGSKTLKLLQEKYQNKKFALDIESTRVESDNKKQRESRKQFYISNGMKAMDYTVNVFDFDMEIMAYNCELSFEEYHTLYHNLYGEKISRYVKLGE
ncbi:GNAT family N-acetyltransferase [Intestinibacter sp.]